MSYRVERRQINATEVVVAIVIIVACQPAPAEDGISDNPRRAESPKAIQIATLANTDILESSGLAASRTTSNLLWTHNDSGDGPRLFAFDLSGQDLGVVSLAGVTAIDWEDIASFRRDETGWLLVADVGDNIRRRETCQLHLLPEPTRDEPTATVRSTIHFRYESGPNNCEAVAVDGTTKTVLLATKLALASEIFELAMPSNATSQVLVARSIATIPIPLVTALDISPTDRGRSY